MPNRRANEKDVEEGVNEEEPLIARGKIGGFFLNFSVWARIAEFAILIAFIVEVVHATGCNNFSYSVWASIAALAWHLIFIIFPMRGKLKFLKFMRVYQPWASLMVVLPAVAGPLGIYFIFFGGCAELRNTVFAGMIPAFLYAGAAWKNESGKDYLWN